MCSNQMSNLLRSLCGLYFPGWNPLSLKHAAKDVRDRGQCPITLHASCLVSKSAEKHRQREMERADVHKNVLLPEKSLKTESTEH